MDTIDSPKKGCCLFRSVLNFSLTLFILLLMLWLAKNFIDNEIADIQEFVSTSYQPVPTDQYEIEALESNAEIKFPPGAHEIYGFIDGFQAISTRIRFNMLPEDLDVFLDSTHCEQPLSEVTAWSSSPNDLDWWQPDQVERAQECSGGTDNFGQWIMIDMSNPDTYIVYISASSQ